MNIENGYYVSERTSMERPYPHLDAGTLYLPFEVEESEEGYSFREYRVHVPITEDIEADVLKAIIASIPDVAKAINGVLSGIFGDGATVRQTETYSSAISSVKARIANDEDKTYGIICRAMFPVWSAGNFIVGDIATHPDTGYPYECFTAHDSITNPDYTIDVRTLWKPWHSRAAEYALPWEQPTGAHDMYKAGEYMVWTDGETYKCIADTAYSPEEYGSAWEVVPT